MPQLYLFKSCFLQHFYPSVWEMNCQLWTLSRSRIRHRKKKLSKSPSDSSRAAKLSPASSSTRLERRQQLQQQHLQAQLLRTHEFQGQQQILLQSGEVVSAVDRFQTSLESSDSLAATDVQTAFMSTDDNAPIPNLHQAELNWCDLDSLNLKITEPLV